MLLLCRMTCGDVGRGRIVGPIAVQLKRLFRYKDLWGLDLISGRMCRFAAYSRVAESVGDSRRCETLVRKSI